MALITAKITHGDYGITLTDVTGNEMQIDIPVEQGGGGKGMRPMQTLLAALIGCSVVDIVSILKKQKQNFTSLHVDVDGVREEGKEPSLWQHISLNFHFGGDIDLGKAQRAVDLSITKYCSVAETLRRAGAVIECRVFVT
ncbi:MAG: OsmC family protein [Ferruginibacter sp.]